MHLEVLVEDASGRVALQTLIPKILAGAPEAPTVRCHPYKGAGHIPKGMNSALDAQKRVLLDRLPALLNGYGKSLPLGLTAVVVVTDLDDRDCRAFLAELEGLRDACTPAPTTLFALSIEELEAWLLGDPSAIRAAYPRASERVLERYRQDSVVGTWEVLADAVHKGGSRALKQDGAQAVGKAKSDWAKEITPHMDVESNRSPSFVAFRQGLRALVGLPDPAPPQALCP
ncbi:MAG: DUF4276 family protein [Deltaproteobacteria bacterium]|nr:DUF4276 family protein [Deltaproteobacteria bacterium]